MAGWIKMPLGMEEGLGPGDFVLDGDPAPLPKKGAKSPSPISGRCPLWPNGWMDQHGTWHRGGPWSRLHCPRLGPSSPPQKKAAEPPSQFSAHCYWGQTAQCIKIPLGVEAGCSPGEFVLDGDPNFRPISVGCKIGGKLVLITNRKSYMSFRLVPKSVTLNDPERHNGRYFALFQRIRVPSGRTV